MAKKKIAAKGKTASRSRRSTASAKKTSKSNPKAYSKKSGKSDLPKQIDQPHATAKPRKSPTKSKTATKRTLLKSSGVFRDEDLSAAIAAAGSQLDKQRDVAREALDRGLIATTRRARGLGMAPGKPTWRHTWEQKYGPITTLGIGLATVDGAVKAPLEYVIKVGVGKKLDPDDVERLSRELLRGTLGFGKAKVRAEVVPRCPTFPVPRGPMRGLAAPTPYQPPPLTAPLRGGVAISCTQPPLSDWGTLGICLTDQNSNWIALTNQHVVKQGNLVQEIGPGAQTETVGTTISRLQNPEFILNNEKFGVDIASIAVLPTQMPVDNVRPLSSWPTSLSQAIPKFLTSSSSPSQLESRHNGTKIYVSGARSGPRDGILLESLDEITVGSMIFRNVISIRGTVPNFIQPGDSGSALLAELRKPGQTTQVPVVIGLVFATDTCVTNVGYACQIAPCLAACNVVPHAKYTF